MISPISHFLPEFSAHMMGFEAGFDLPAETDELEPDIAPAADDTEQRLAEAEAAGFAQGSASLEAALAQQAADLAARHAEELEAARRQWIEDVTILTATLDAALAGLEDRIAEGVVEVLEPVFEAAVRRQAADDLRQALASLVSTGQGTTIRISGPSDLVEPLRLQFEGRVSIETDLNEASELEIEADGTMIRTQLGAWADNLRAQIKEIV